MLLLSKIIGLHTQKFRNQGQVGLLDTFLAVVMGSQAQVCTRERASLHWSTARLAAAQVCAFALGSHARLQAGGAVPVGAGISAEFPASSWKSFPYCFLTPAFDQAQFPPFCPLTLDLPFPPST